MEIGIGGLRGALAEKTATWTTKILGSSTRPRPRHALEAADLGPVTEECVLT